MFVVASELVGALKAAALFASTDETRPHMNCVHVEATGSALRVVATDGHTLWCCEVTARDAASDPAPVYQTPWDVRVSDVDGIVKSLKEAGRAEVELSLSKRAMGGVEYEQAAERFPPYARIVPSLEATKPGEVLPEFAAEYVARCCEAFRLYGRGLSPEVPKKGLNKREKELARNTANAFISPPIAWRVGGELDPSFFFSPKFPGALAIVMPRKGAGSTAVPIESFVERVRSDAKRSAALSSRRCRRDWTRRGGRSR